MFKIKALKTRTPWNFKSIGIYYRKNMVVRFNLGKTNTDKFQLFQKSSLGKQEILELEHYNKIKFK